MKLSPGSPIMRLSLLACVLTALAAEKPFREDFEDARAGELPPGWSAAITGEGKAPEWKVVEDDSAPKGSKTLVQSSTSPNRSFNLCIADKSSMKDLEMTVSFKALKGKIDQGGGLVWRYADEKNYYVARFNPLEDNLRVYKVVAGKRIQLATKEEVSAPAGKWHKISIRIKGDAITCSLNGKDTIEVKDDTFPKAGKIGLWTKADAQTAFDGLVAAPLNEE
jgi:hypothetical protein